MRWTSLLLGMSCLGLPADALAGKRVAVVVGIGDYPNLADGNELPRAEADAGTLAAALRAASFDTVYELIGASATRAAADDLLLGTLPGQLEPGDTLLWCFVGHGFGGDFEDPYLLLADSRIEEADRTALKIFELSREIGKRLEGVHVALILDAAHEGASSGVALLGPSARSIASWPAGVFVLTGAGANETLPDGLFLPVVLEGLRGHADADRDGMVSARELHSYASLAVVERTAGAAHPAEGGSYDPNMPLTPNLGGIASVVPEDDGLVPAWRRPVATGLVASGLAVGGGLGLLGNIRARQTCDVSDGEAQCIDRASVEAYRGARTLTYAAYGVGAALAVTGAGLLVLPLDDGAMIVFRTRF